MQRSNTVNERRYEHGFRVQCGPNADQGSLWLPAGVQNPLGYGGIPWVSFVAGAGFEPATFGL